MPRSLLAAVIAAAIVILLLLIAAVLRRRRLSSAEQERARRETIHETGRMASGLVTEFQGDTVFFTYSVGGIEYQATQDISPFRAGLPPEGDHLLVGPCSVKYLVENAANSIVICEGWNGLRPAKRG
ncbi:MAG TPA: hypothetical protein VHZ07_09185 [Bryobacteraceae bacterium]|jgi:hypothetical protein|nr:hypothetical protein [Bryobacteraceae bacterium]